MIVLRAFVCAVAFLTRFPVPRTAVPSSRVNGLSVAFFPLVGLLLGAVAALLHVLLQDRLHLEPHILWALVFVSLQAFLTGALHLDGLADVVDGLGGGEGDRDRTLRIMEDSHIGGFGVTALVLFLMAKVMVINEVLLLEGSLTLLLVYPVVARFAVVPLVACFPCARPTGLARDYHDHCTWIAIFLASLILATTLVLAGKPVWIPSGAALAVALLVGLVLTTRLKGLTGDGYGTAIELGELTFLLAAVIPQLTERSAG